MSQLNQTRSTLNKIYPIFILPTFTVGVASVFDVFGSLNTFKYSKTGIDADYQALRADFKMVASDMASAIKEYENEQKA